MANRCILTLTATLLLCLPLTGALSCYDSSGNQNDGMGLCDPDASESVCCGWTDICLSNGLCRTTKNDTLTSFFFNGCTDDTLEAPQCAPIASCKKIQGALQGNGLKDCGDNEYCCYGNGDCDCSNSTLVFTLPPGNIVATLPVSSEYSKFLSTAATASATATSTTPGITSATATSTSSGASSASTAASSNDKYVSVGVGVGVAVGVGVPLIAAIVGVWFWLRRRKNKNGGKYAQAPPAEDHKDAGPYMDAPTPDYQSGYPQYNNAPMELDSRRDPVQLDSVVKTGREPSELPAESRL